MRIFPTAIFIAAAFSARAEVKLPAIFSDHMVMQADATAPVWGWAEPGEEVAISLAGQSQTTQAGADGKWMVKFDKLKPNSQPQTLTVKGTNTLMVKDVLVGEVWLASGQSNMAMSVKSARDFEQEKAKANLPDLRMFIVQRDSQPELRADCKGRWWVCNADTVARFSATAYFFGRELHTGLRAPVGLINSSWPGTPIEAWTSVEAQSKIPEYAAVSEPWVKADAQRWDEAAAEAKYEEQRAQWTEAVRAAEAANKPAPRPPLKEIQPRLLPNHPANLYNAMIAPIIPFGIRGAIWYQGEANSAPAKAGFYQYQLPTLIEDWRARWGYDFPFAWVQLPNLDSSSASRDWPTVREAMLKTLQVRKTGMAVTIDIGDPRNIHPKNKQEVGRRLAFWALGSVYGEKVPAICGPLPAGHQIRGNEVVLSFDHTDGGLMARGGELKGFLIAGEDKKWVNASAKFEGDKVIVSGPDVQRPVAVRYAWANNPDCNLYNGAGLPASPFRTDNWK